ATNNLRRFPALGRPDTWFYRQVELALSLRFPVFGNRRLVTRSGAWTSRRTESP
ncbi:DUF3487 family protein, partial [Pseudomonas aeruginosa]|uniref:DUF3487 family protein n=1 Tax=Pseudomonas aeruginosa TaxID=287 RepID=UPI0031B67851